MALDISRIAIPAEPGIYIMKDSDGTVIYIGKAKDLRSRVKSYFSGTQNYKTQKLVSGIAGMDFIATDNEREAFLLESNMIKKYRPKFNIELKDQQRYTYLQVTDEKYPRLLVARRTRDGRFLGRGRTFGPFTEGSSKLLTIGTLRRAFQMRICKTLPKKVCLEYHLGNCEGPCEFEEAQERYGGHVESLQKVLQGGDQGRAFADGLRAEMARASELLQFERAKEMRDTLARLDSLQVKQSMEHVRNSDEEYFGIDVRFDRAVVMNFRMINGVIRDSGRFLFDMVGDNSFGSFLYQYYSTRRVPGLIIVNRRPDDATALQRMLSERAQGGVRIRTPVSKSEHDIVGIIMKNAGLIHEKGGHDALSELQDVLGLEAAPDVIECFDISNHGTDFAVGAMSRFVDGSPDRQGYRRFRVRSVSGMNDSAMIGEVVRRRYLRLRSEGARMPDLVMVDGGKGQLTAARRALGSCDDLPCVALAKQNEEVYTPRQKNPIRMPRDSPALKILQHARDEAHRIGVAYNRALRRRRLSGGR